MQKAFEIFRAKFADSVTLVHPNENLPYSIYTDASGKTVGAVLMQTNEQGETCLVSTASRVLSGAEQRCSVAEQELSAIVYGLEKFRVYVYGHKIYLNTDNKALTFLNRCALTSNRIARWVLQIQDYDIEIKHISGSKNFLADTISRNPGGLSKNEIKALTKPREMKIMAINLGVDQSVAHKLKDLAAFQDNDPKLRDVKLVIQQTSVESVSTT
jgi:hypothetical protein